jgi:hypothetical protein
LARPIAGVTGTAVGRSLDGGEHDVEGVNLRTAGSERFLGSRLRLEQ